MAEEVEKNTRRMAEEVARHTERMRKTTSDNTAKTAQQAAANARKQQEMVNAHTQRMERISAKHTESLARLTDQHTRKMARDAERNTGKMAAEVEKNTTKTSGAVGVMGRAIAGIAFVKLAKDALMLADGIRVLEGRILRVTGSQAAFAQGWDAINKAADEAGVSIQDSAASFERFLTATKGMGATVAQVGQFNNLIQKLGRLSGASTAEMSNALTQLSQSFQGGVVRAEEWNSIIEQAPEILRQAARGIKGVDGDLGKLRQMMLDGKLSSEALFNAIMKGSADINTEFSKLPISLEQGMQGVQNQFTRLIKNLDATWQLTDKISYSLKFWADTMAEAGAKVNANSELVYRQEQARRNAAIKGIQAEIAAKSELASIGLSRREQADLKVENKLRQDKIDKLIEESRIARIGRMRKDEDNEKRKRPEQSADDFLIKSKDDPQKIAAARAAADKAYAEMSDSVELKLQQRRIARIEEINKIENLSAEDKIKLTKAAYDEEKRLFDDHLASTEKARLRANKKPKEKKTPKEKAAKEIKINEESGRKFLSDMLALNNDAYAEVARIQLERIASAQEMRAKDLISEQEYQAALTAISINASDSRKQLADDEAAKKAAVNQAQIESLSNMAASISTITANLGADSDSNMGRIASSFGTLATSIIATSQAMAAAQALADPTALTLPQKLANYATILGAFASITSGLSKAGGRLHGGAVTAGAMHPINESGIPELIQQGGKQFIIPNKNGEVTPMSGGSANVTVINNGTPKTATVETMSDGQVRVIMNDMIAKNNERIASSLGSGRDMFGKAQESGNQIKRRVRG